MWQVQDEHWTNKKDMDGDFDNMHMINRACLCLGMSFINRTKKIWPIEIWHIRPFYNNFCRGQQTYRNQWGSNQKMNLNTNAIDETAFASNIQEYATHKHAR